MKYDCPTPTRMEAARELRGVSIEDMCRDLGIDPRTYEKWEEVEEDIYGCAGEGAYDFDIPASVELMKEVAAYLRFPLDWFYADEMNLASPLCFSWVSGSQYLDQQIEEHLKQAEAKRNANRTNETNP